MEFFPFGPMKRKALAYNPLLGITDIFFLSSLLKFGESSFVLIWINPAFKKLIICRLVLTWLELYTLWLIVRVNLLFNILICLGATWVIFSHAVQSRTRWSNTRIVGIN